MVEILEISFKFFLNEVIESLDRIESGTKVVSDFRGNHTKSSRTCGGFGAGLTDEIAGSRTNRSARNIFL